LWGQGWGTEMATLVVEHYLPALYERGASVRSGENFELRPLKGVEATARIHNFASLKILEKLNFSCEEIVERHGAERAVYLLSFE